MISLIVAMGEGRVIGLNNEMPWHLPADLAYFKKVTTGHTVIMGRKTFESIGRPLPNRNNIILTRDRNFMADGCTIVHSIEEALALDGDLFVIGGAEIYKQFLPYTDRIYVTQIDHSFEGDTFFPQMGDEWVVVHEEAGIRDEKNRYDHRFLIYKKMSKS
ncbi:dihydrofolate reductase [Anaerobacillus sp. MEB173]|uniref:dihydrofolate reductase n=1 Tax=Anaerobacillus sp. MEB173 TaxID=3383345 RepID=UPI003F9176AC